MPTDDELRASPPKRPALLGSLIDAQNEQYTAIDEKYITFLKLATQAQKDMETSCLVVSANVSIKPGVEVEDESDSKGSWKFAKKNNFLNSSFSNMFDLYKSYQSGDTSGTFDALDDTEASLSTENVLAFLRDMQVMPKLLSRDEFTRVWAEMSQDQVARQSKPLVRQTLEQFKEFIVRIALFVFNAIGMRKAILACSGIVPTPELMTQYFLHYIRMNDDTFITEYISNTRAQRLEKASSRAGDNIELLSPLVAKALLRNEVNQFQQVDAVPTRKMLRDEGEKKAKLEQEAATATDKSATPSKRRDARKVRSPLSKFSGASMIPPEIRALLDNPPHATHVVATRDPPAEEKKKILTKAEERALAQKQKDDAVLQAKTDKANLPPPRNNYKELYHKELLTAVNAYCQPKPDKAIIEGACASHGSFIDLGRVDPGSICIIRILLHNRSANDMNVELTARGFDDENSKVTKNPKPLVAGLSRMVYYQFRAPSTTRSLIGNLELAVTNHLERFDDTVKIPVFLCISPAPLMGSSREMPTLTVDTLAQTLEKYVPACFMHVAITDIEGMSQIGSTQNSIANTTLTSSLSLSASSSNGSQTSAKSYRGTSFATPRDTWYGQGRVGGGGVKLDTFSTLRTVTKANLREQANTALTRTAGVRGCPKSHQRHVSSDKFFVSGSGEDNESFAMSTLGDPLFGYASQWETMEA